METHRKINKMFAKCFSIILLFIHLVYCVAVGKIISTASTSALAGTSRMAENAAFVAARPISKTRFPATLASNAKTFTLDLKSFSSTTLRGPTVVIDKVKPKPKAKSFQFITKAAQDLDDSSKSKYSFIIKDMKMSSSRKGIRNIEERKQLELNIKKVRRQILAERELGMINMKNDNPKTAFNPLTGKKVDIYYTQAFVSKHNGKPDRGVHSGAYNTILNNPKKIIVSKKPHFYLQKVGQAGLGIRESIFRQLGIEYDRSAKYIRVAISTKNKVSLSSYHRSEKMKWYLDSNGVRISQIELEGFYIPNTKESTYGDRKRDVLIVDHMHIIQ